MNDVHVSKGKKVVHLDLSEKGIAKADLEKLVLGPTGNLRAPTIRKGKVLIVGFNEEAYKKLL